VVLTRLRAGEWLAAAGGVALIVALVAGGTWSIVVDVLLAGLAVLALALAVLQATQTSAAKPLAAGVLSVVLGAIGVLLGLVGIVVESGSSSFLALAALLAITAGGWLSIANEHVRGLPPGPEPELRPSPRIADRAQP
jgi:hypothetical protein